MVQTTSMTLLGRETMYGRGVVIDHQPLGSAISTLNWKRSSEAAVTPSGRLKLRMDGKYIKEQLSVSISVAEDKQDMTITGWYSRTIKSLITGRVSKSNYSHERDDA
jgi:hypothetical protein